MNRRKNQATNRSWTEQSGVERRVSVVLHEGRTGDVPENPRHATNAIDYYQREGRRLQARAVSQGLRGAGRWLINGTAALAARLRARRAVWVAERELARLDDRLLRDIGIDRGNIPAVVRGTLAAAGQRPVPAPGLAGTRARVHVDPACNDAQSRDAA